MLLQYHKHSARLPDAVEGGSGSPTAGPDRRGVGGEVNHTVHRRGVGGEVNLPTTADKKRGAGREKQAEGGGRKEGGVGGRPGGQIKTRWRQVT